PNEPPHTKGHTSGSGEGRLEENIELTDLVPTPHDSPFTGGYTSKSDKGRITLAELMETCTILSNGVTQLETEISTTKAVYNKAFITLTNIVKKLESQLKQKEKMDKDENINLVSEQGEVQETVENSRGNDDETLAETLLNINRSSAKDKGKRIMQETELPKKLKKKEMIQLSLDEELAQKLYAEELAKEEARQEQERYNLEKALEAGFDLQQGSSKKQRLDQQTNEIEEEVGAQGDSDQEVEALKLYRRIIPEEDIAIEDIPLDTKPSVIIEEDLETLWKLVKDKYVRKQKKAARRAADKLEQEDAKRQRIKEQNESIELKRCLEIIPDDNEMWQLKLYPYLLNPQSLLIKRSTKKGGKAFSKSSEQMNMVYYLLVEKMYPFTRNILNQMWNDVRLQVSYEVEMAYDLLRLIRRQINEGYIPE
nr:hypothetical protein [Tanacetum cinerariifolium]